MMEKDKQYIRKLKIKGQEKISDLTRGIKVIGKLEKRMIPQKRRYYFLWYLGVSLFLSFFIPTMTNIFANFSELEKWFYLGNYKHSPLLFLSLIPIIITIKKNIIFKDGPLKALTLIFYYIIFIPVLNYIFSGNMQTAEKSEGIIIKIISILNIILLFWSHVVLFKYSFVDIMKKRRKIKSSDIVITFLIYVTLAISFGFVYFLITVSSAQPAFRGMESTDNNLYLYFQHIYFSFITITTVGYGDISPIKFITQLITMVEVITGIALLNFSLGITLSSGILNFSQENEKDV
ncbi:MAG: potassium channel family protein [Fusobacteriaceae bacterium]